MILRKNIDSTRNSFILRKTHQKINRLTKAALQQRELQGVLDGLVFSVKQISPFSSSEVPIVIVGKSPLSAGLVRKQVPLLHPAA